MPAAGARKARAKVRVRVEEEVEQEKERMTAVIKACQERDRLWRAYLMEGIDDTFWRRGYAAGSEMLREVAKRR